MKQPLRVLLAARAVASLKTRVPKKVRERLAGAVERLAENPFPHNARKLKGHLGHYRLRVGVWRVLYQVDLKGGVVLVYSIAHRSGAYR